MSAPRSTPTAGRTVQRPSGGDTRRILYVADPSCVWCWRFAPVVRQIAASYGAAAPVAILLGRDDPLAAAVAAVRARAPDRALAFLERVQRAVHAERREAWDDRALAALAGDVGLAPAALAAGDAAAARAALAGDVALVARLGVTGFPTLLLEDPRGYALLTAGCRSFERLAPAVEAWIADTAGAG